ncbi:MAG TPA: sodium:proton exchanger [Acidimicrobiia bacterium]|nr:sodium:proton exchanger [Acidimicrobiia bacterium]
METQDLNPGRQIALMLLALAVAVPGVAIRLGVDHPDPLLGAVAFGVAIVGAAFMISWAAEIIQLDVGSGLALALLALIAVLPEYAVDFVLTADAGQEFAATGASDRFGPLALANMTGANQLLIGLGWPLVILLGTWRVRKTGSTPRMAENATPTTINLTRAQSVDIAYLALASIYGMTLFLKETLSPFDAVILVGIYVAYMIRLSGATPGIPHLVGPSAWVATLPKTRRRALNYAMFAVSATVIVLVAHEFAVSLQELGEDIGVSQFLLLKWLAPLASEAPELLIATLFAWRLSARTGIGALISSKVNQWTLLVGTLPIVFMIFAGQVHGLPLNEVQRDELWVTATQSVFAVAIIASRSISRTEALGMLGLFVVQLAESWLVEVDVISHEIAAAARIGVGVMFLLAAAWVLRRDFRVFTRALRDGFRTPWAELESRHEHE